MLALAGPRVASAHSAGWGRFVEQVESGQIRPAEARSRLASLYQQAPTRSAAAMRLGMHRNTLRRHLQRLRACLGDDAVPW